MDDIEVTKQATLDGMNACKQHCAQAIYLPTHHFKNAASLTMALDNIQHNLKNNKYKTSTTDHNAMLTMLAKNIAITTIELDSDYTGKLDLINAAIAHPLLKHRPFFYRIIQIIFRLPRQLIPLILRRSCIDKCPNRNEAQNILHQAKIAIYQSRNSIFLC